MSEAETRQIVLIVDSNPTVRAPIADFLRDCGYRVIEANDTDEAETVLFDSSIRVAVVLCDAAAVGVRKGLELGQHVRQTLPDVLFLLAGTHEKAAALAGELCEDGDDIKRPYDPNEVIDRIRRALASRMTGSNS